MTSLTLSDIRTFVRTAIDELQINESSYVPDDGTSNSDDQDMNTIIDGKVIEAVTYVHLNAPISLLLDSESLEESKITTETGSDVVELTMSDMLRFVMLKAADSSKTIVSLVTKDSPIALMQSDDFVKGDEQSPVAVLSANNEDKIITYYSLKDKVTADTEVGELFDKILYIPYPKIDENNNVLICKDVKLAILNHIVGLVLLVYQDNHADSFFEQSKLYMQ